MIATEIARVPASTPKRTTYERKDEQTWRGCVGKSNGVGEKSKKALAGQDRIPFTKLRNILGKENWGEALRPSGADGGGRKEKECADTNRWQRT